MNVPDAQPIHIHRLPFYVTAYKLPEGTFVLWDGDRQAYFHRRSEWREALGALGRARAQAMGVPAIDPNLRAAALLANGASA